MTAASLLGVAPSPASADTTVDTISQLNVYFAPFGTDSSTPGAVIGQTYGQVVTAPAGEHSLDSFTVVMHEVPVSVVFRGEVFAWDGSKASGPSLYESPPRTTTWGSVDEEVTFATGGVPVTPGEQYVVFASLSKDYESSTGHGAWGTVTDNNAYTGGQFVYLDNRTYESDWTTDAWRTADRDLAFKAVFTSAVPPSSAPTIEGPANASGQVNHLFNYAPIVNGNPHPTVQLRNSSDPLPAGLNLDPDSGVISGVPADTSVGTYDVKLRARNGVTPNDRLNLTITIHPGVLALNPTIDGTAQVGQTLTADPNLLGPSSTDLSYQWFADGDPIAIGTDPTYTVQKSDLLKEITVAITASHVGYLTATVTSAPTDPVHWNYLFPKLSVNPTTVHAGDVVNLSGVGYEPLGILSITCGGGVFGGGTVIGLAFVDEYGEFTTNVAIPSTTSYGRNLIRVGSGFFQPSITVTVTPP